MFATPSILDDSYQYMEELKKEVQGIKELAIHGPFSELVPASRDKLIREITYSRFSKAYEIGKDLGAKNLIFHTGFIPKTYLAKDWLDKSINFWTVFLAGKEDMEIHIENVYEDDYELIYNLVKEINNPNFSICLDIGHINSNSSKTFEYWIEGLNEKIRYVHLHNNDGINDNHFGLNKGVIDIKKVLTMLQEYSPNAKWTIETSEVEESINWLFKNEYLKECTVPNINTINFNV